MFESRLNDEKRKNFNTGDKITFYKEPEKTETMQVIILDKCIFRTFDNMNFKVSNESTEIKWVTIEEAKNLISKDDYAMQRMLKKYENLLISE